jgi:hypothetical protein
MKTNGMKLEAKTNGVDWGYSGFPEKQYFSL